LENIPRQALKNTVTWLFASIPGWILNTVGPIVSGIVVALFVPQNATLLTQSIYGAIGAVIALVIIFSITYIVYLWIVPFRQRNEALAQVRELQKQISTPVAVSKIIRLLSKVEIVLKAIEEAQHNTPKDNDVIVYMTVANQLGTAMFPEELKSILLKLQNDDNILTLKSFPEWLLEKDKTTGQYILMSIRSFNDPAVKSFTISIHDGFAQYIRTL